MSDSSSETRPSLLVRLQDRADQEAWCEFDRRYSPKIRGWCGRWGLQEADAEDVTQRVLVRLLDKMRTFVYDRQVGQFRSWLWTLARNALSDFLKEQGRPGGGSGDPAVEQLLANLAARTELEELLGQQFDYDLWEEARWLVSQRVKSPTWEAYRLTAEEGLPAEEAARRTGLSLDRVYQAKYRVLRMLRDEVQRLQG